MFDLLIKGGSVVDPVALTSTVQDVAVSGGQIAAMATGLPERDAGRVIDARGLIVAPGLVDLHVHVWSGVAELAIDNDPNHLARGTTTVVDAGSSGSNTFPGFRRYVIEPSATRTLAFLHISGMGQLDLEIGELEDIRWARVDRAIETARANPDLIVGIKLRLSTMLVASNARVAFARAHEAAAAIGRPLMLHIGGTADEAFTLEDALGRLRPGDIVTHSFTGWPPGIVDSRPATSSTSPSTPAGAACCSTSAMAPGVSRGARRKPRSPTASPRARSAATCTSATSTAPSTTWSRPSRSSCCSAFRSRRSSRWPRPARRPRSAAATSWAGSRSGRVADLSVLRLIEGPVTLTDSRGETRQGDRRLEPVVTVRAGAVSEPTPWGGA